MRLTLHVDEGANVGVTRVNATVLEVSEDGRRLRAMTDMFGEMNFPNNDGFVLARWEPGPPGFQRPPPQTPPTPQAPQNAEQQPLPAEAAALDDEQRSGTTTRAEDTRRRPRDNIFHLRDPTTWLPTLLTRGPTGEIAAIQQRYGWRAPTSTVCHLIRLVADQPQLASVKEVQDIAFELSLQVERREYERQRMPRMAIDATIRAAEDARWLPASVLHEKKIAASGMALRSNQFGRGRGGGGAPRGGHRHQPSGAPPRT